MAIFYQSLQKFPSSKAICILVHGLNNHPAVLKDIADFLEDLSMPVVVVSLTGHYQDFDKLKTVTKEIWQRDVLEAYMLARRQYEQVHLVAYSLGAAIGLDLLSEKVKFDKMVLLAPAIAPRIPVQLLEYIAPIKPSLSLYSMAPKGYRANAYIPLKAYIVLFEFYHSLQNKKFAQTNVPTIIVMDPKDETMDLNKIKETISSCSLNHWEILPLNSDEVIKQVKFHHLIVDKKGMGAKNWETFTNRIKNFFSHKH